MHLIYTLIKKSTFSNIYANIIYDYLLSHNKLLLFQNHKNVAFYFAIFVCSTALSRNLIHTWVSTLNSLIIKNRFLVAEFVSDNHYK